MAKSSIKVTKTNSYFKIKSKKSGNGKKGNPNKCPVCGKFMGSGKSG